MLWVRARAAIHLPATRTATMLAAARFGGSFAPRCCFSSCKAVRALCGGARIAEASSKWREVPSDTSAQRRAAWAASDAQLHATVAQHVPADLAHNGAEPFDGHLKGVQAVLRSWGMPEHLCSAGLFHSIYGTEGFQGFKLPLKERAAIARLIGPAAERLAWIFCMVDRASVDETAFSPPPPNSGIVPSFRARPELGAFKIQLRSEQEWVDFLTITLADWLEQVEGAATKENVTASWGVGQAWAYRREAYAAMAKLLSERYGIEAAAAMHAEVYAREPASTRSLVQPQVPPMSESAREAREAIASAELSFDDDAAIDTAAFLEQRVQLDWRPAHRL
eukprot:6206056-Pleurochrysis_carterae.AAC.4